MFILPVRTQPPNLRQKNATRAKPPLSLQTDEVSHSRHKSPSQKPGAMTSVMPSTRQPALNRPKLSLKTCVAPSPTNQKALNVTNEPDTPTYANKYANAFDAVPQPPSTSLSSSREASPSLRPNGISKLSLVISESSSLSSSASSSSSGCTSPFPVTAPYSLPLGARSILRNSPLPRPYLSASSSSSRIPRKMFPPVKKVLFRDLLEEFIPKRILKESSYTSDSETGEKRRRDVAMEDWIRLQRSAVEEGAASSTPVHGRHKRQREWIWRPVEDDVLAADNIDETPITRAAAPSTATNIKPTSAGDVEHPEIKAQLASNVELVSPRRGLEPVCQTADQPRAPHETAAKSDVTARNIDLDGPDAPGSELNSALVP